MSHLTAITKTGYVGIGASKLSSNGGRTATRKHGGFFMPFFSTSLMFQGNGAHVQGATLKASLLYRLRVLNPWNIYGFQTYNVPAILCKRSILMRKKQSTSLSNFPRTTIKPSKDYPMRTKRKRHFITNTGYKSNSFACCLNMIENVSGQNRNDFDEARWQLLVEQYAQIYLGWTPPQITPQTPQVTTLEFNGKGLTTFLHDGTPFVAMRSVVDSIGLSWGSQRDRLKEQHEKFSCTAISTTGSDGKRYKMVSIPLKKLPGWLFSINPNRVRADLKDTVVRYQEECFTALHDYWNGKQRKAIS